MDVTAGALAETKHWLATVVFAQVRASAQHSKNVSYFSKYKVKRVPERLIFAQLFLGLIKLTHLNNPVVL